jgi:uncharacterized protein (TIGR00255 family)
MTGFGEAHNDSPNCSVQVEVRSVNNRHLKLSVRGTEPYPHLESEFEKLVRKTIKRGTLHLTIRVARERPAGEQTLNVQLLKGLLHQLQEAWPEADTSRLLASLLAVPGVVAEPQTRLSPPDDEWPLVEATVQTALANLDRVRRSEGRAMADELLALLTRLETEVANITTHLPRVMTDFRTRLQERMTQALAATNLTIEPDHLIRELALYADRTDVSEEITRLGAHFAQFRDVVQTESPGRRLEFIVQELGRETNTLGSKAGDVTISRHVVEMKATLEKMRELIANVE